MKNGYIKLHRKLLDSDTFKNEKLLKIWIWILLKANHKENTFLLGRQKMTVSPGEFVMGLNSATDDLNLAKSTIHYWINYLEHINKVKLKKTNKYTIITILNWSTYQEVELQKNSKRTLKETNNNDKNEKNICEPSSQEHFSSNEYIKEMINNKQRHIQIIGQYFLIKKAQFPSKKAIQDEIKRWLKDARTLAEYDEARIVRAIKLVKNKFPDDWKLSTVSKYIS